MSIPEAVAGVVFDGVLLELYIMYLMIWALSYPAEILPTTVRMKIFYLFLFCSFHASFVAYSNANQGVITWTKKETRVSQEKHPLPAPTLETSGRTLPSPRTSNGTAAVPASHSMSVGLSALCRGLAEISHFPAENGRSCCCNDAGFRLFRGTVWLALVCCPCCWLPGRCALGRAACLLPTAGRWLEVSQPHFPHQIMHQMFNHYLFKLVDHSGINLFWMLSQKVFGSWMGKSKNKTKPTNLKL